MGERRIRYGDSRVGTWDGVLQFRILRGCSEKVQVEVGDGIFVADGAFVPVVGDAFVAGGPGEAAAVAGDGEKRFEHGLVEGAFGVFGGFVGHEAVDERVGGWLDEDAAEGAVEEVWVVADGLVEARRAEVGQHVWDECVSWCLRRTMGKYYAPRS
jgi:hypothetical protein